MSECKFECEVECHIPIHRLISEFSVARETCPSPKSMPHWIDGMESSWMYFGLVDNIGSMLNACDGQKALLTGIRGFVFVVPPFAALAFHCVTSGEIDVACEPILIIGISETRSFAINKNERSCSCAFCNKVSGV